MAGAVEELGDVFVPLWDDGVAVAAGSGSVAALLLLIMVVLSPNTAAGAVSGIVTDSGTRSDGRMTRGVTDALSVRRDDSCDSGDDGRR